ncbi:hypothetical protein LIL_10949 [Leptospira interrogans serovar Linhai str. 56609]|nr:hypothetical protein LIL_10949 [Leptospira interrogans serovar Linhai str. 56609]
MFKMVKKYVSTICLLIAISVGSTIFSRPLSISEKNQEEKIKNDFQREFRIENFVLIPAGEFVMGCVAGDLQCDEREKPPKAMKIVKPFYMGKYEVTQTQWQLVMRYDQSDFKKCGGSCPVNNVTWFSVQVFLKQLNYAMQELGKATMVRMKRNGNMQPELVRLQSIIGGKKWIQITYGIPQILIIKFIQLVKRNLTHLAFLT